jgi:hypothetical protein
MLRLGKSIRIKKPIRDLKDLKGTTEKTEKERKNRKNSFFHPIILKSFRFSEKFPFFPL